MDAFFASVELLRYPELRDLPVVVGGGRDRQPVLQGDGTRDFARLRDYTGRGVVTTSTYAARRLGVFSAMGMMKAAKLAPDAIVLPPDFDAYRELSRRFKAAVADWTPAIEDRGIDEIYIDLGELVHERLARSGGSARDAALAIAQGIKDAVRLATGLSCSMSVAPNKLLAKIGSELDKPDGLTWLDWSDLPARIWPLAVRSINGIGPRAGERLALLGLDTVGALAHADPAVLQKHFGAHQSAWLLAAANGVDERPVQSHSEPRSVSRETTFEHDLHPRRDRARLSDIFTRLCERVAQDLARKGYAGRTIGIKLRFDDFSTVTRDTTLDAATRDAARIRQAATACLRRVPLERRLRLLGVRVGALEPSQAAPSRPRPVQLELPLED
ncbi:Y-family DNA polymerase [Amphibiibacter pelophylacis]|uniref:Y-family DNA polymerase n=1 Tax=Amphibiibacter pelophylacis TaxID=1799477 RepID=UPI003BFA6E0A